MADSSPPQLSRVTSSVISWKRIGGNLRMRWLADYEEQSIRALISRHGGTAEARILAVWKLRNTAGKFERGTVVFLFNAGERPLGSPPARPSRLAILSQWAMARAMPRASTACASQRSACVAAPTAGLRVRSTCSLCVRSTCSRALTCSRAPTRRPPPGVSLR